MAFDKIKYNNEFNKTHYARLSIQIPIGDRAKVDNYWKSQGFKSFNAYVLDLIKKDMSRKDK